MYNNTADKLKKLVTIIKDEKDKKAVDLSKTPSTTNTNTGNNPKK